MDTTNTVAVCKFVFDKLVTHFGALNFTFIWRDKVLMKCIVAILGDVAYLQTAGWGESGLITMGKSPVLN